MLVGFFLIRTIPSLAGAPASEQQHQPAAKDQEVVQEQQHRLFSSSTSSVFSSFSTRFSISSTSSTLSIFSSPSARFCARSQFWDSLYSWPRREKCLDRFDFDNDDIDGKEDEAMMRTMKRMRMEAMVTMMSSALLGLRLIMALLTYERNGMPAKNRLFCRKCDN